jgi:glycosyltransferase involved in cell wall biosynthesis
MEIQLYPLISIGIPTFNRNRGIGRTLESVWRQCYPNLEIIVSDNCSTDDTQEVLQEITRAHPELKCYRQDINIGMINNFEFVLRKATGKYFMWVADDDILADGVLLKYVTFLESHPLYSLVSGEIKYWLDDKQGLCERGFTFEQKSSSLRVLGYYSKVVYGGMIHGLMRRELTKEITLRKVIGNDFHFIANLAYLGEIKHFQFVGYHKNLGGTSKNFKEYALHMGDSHFAAYFPHLKMACDAFNEIMYRSSVYAEMPLPSKFTLALSSFSGMIVRYYGTIFPFMIGGKIKRLISKSPAFKLKAKY